MVKEMPRVWVVADLAGCYAALKEASYLLAETPTESVFAHFDPALEPESWERGRAFGKVVELRWRKLRRGYQSTLFYKIDALPSHLQAFVDQGQSLPLWDCDREIIEYSLWGRYSLRERCWKETRIPGLPIYPVRPSTDGGRAALLVEQYSRAGTIEFVRYSDVVL